MTPTLDPDILTSWIGRTESLLDTIDPAKARLMQATLDQTPSLTPGAPLPPLWHWLYFTEIVRTSDLAPDGLAPPGPLWPPVALPNRMWAGARFNFHAPLTIGQIAERHREVTSVTLKEGRSGPLCFVTYRDSFRADARTLFTEDWDVVFRSPPAPDEAPKPVQAPYEPAFTETPSLSVPLLFRYSALTFNSHRIHYDPDYARDVEHYPSLLAHGPLVATLLMDFATSHAEFEIRDFRLRATAPSFLNQPFRLAGRAFEDRLHVWAETGNGTLAMDAEARPEQPA